MNILIPAQWGGIIAWATLITAIGGVVTIIVRVIQTLTKFSSDLMTQTQEDNQKLRASIDLVEKSRAELADQLIRVHKEVAETIDTNSDVVRKLRAELEENRQANAQLVRDVTQLKQQVADALDANKTLVAEIKALRVHAARAEKAEKVTRPKTKE